MSHLWIPKHLFTHTISWTLDSHQISLQFIISIKGANQLNYNLHKTLNKKKKILYFKISIKATSKRRSCTSLSNMQCFNKSLWRTQVWKLNNTKCYSKANRTPQQTKTYRKCLEKKNNRSIKKIYLISWRVWL